MRRRRGFTLIELMIVVAVLAVIIALAIPSLLHARKMANEGVAISFMRLLTNVNEQYRTRFSSYAGSLADLNSANYIDDAFASTQKAGYSYNYAAGAFTWSCAADPMTPGSTGDRYFYSDQSGVIRFSTSATATSSSPPLD